MYSEDITCTILISITFTMHALCTYQIKALHTVDTKWYNLLNGAYIKSNVNISNQIPSTCVVQISNQIFIQIPNHIHCYCIFSEYCNYQISFALYFANYNKLHFGMYEMKFIFTEWDPYHRAYEISYTHEDFRYATWRYFLMCVRFSTPLHTSNPHRCPGIKLYIDIYYQIVTCRYYPFHLSTFVFG